jgi:flagellar biosynthesis GTPase FlhF
MSTHIYKMGYCPLLDDSNSGQLSCKNSGENLWASAIQLAVNDWNTPVELLHVALSPVKINTYLLVSAPAAVNEESEIDVFFDYFSRLLPDHYGWTQSETSSRKDFITKIIGKIDDWHYATIERKFEFFDISPKLLLHYGDTVAQLSTSTDETTNESNRENKNEKSTDNLIPQCRQLMSFNQTVIRRQLKRRSICIPYHPSIKLCDEDLSSFFNEMLYTAPCIVSVRVLPLPDKMKKQQNRIHSIATVVRRKLEPYHSLMNLNNEDYTDVEQFYSGYLHPNNLFQFEITVLGKTKSSTGSLALAFTAQLGGSSVLQPTWNNTQQETQENIFKEFAQQSISLSGSSNDKEKWETLLQYSKEILTQQECTAVLRLPIGTTEGLPGIEVRQPAPFATSTTNLVNINETTPDSIKLGQIKTTKVFDEKNNNNSFFHSIKLNQLCKHAFIVGSTGSGKTTTVQYLLKQIADAGIPFLVIEPSMKAEYFDKLRKDIPQLVRLVPEKNFFFDPLRLPTGITVLQHISYLKSCFEAALPVTESGAALLELGLHRYYQTIFNTNTYTIIGSPSCTAIIKPSKDLEFVVPSFQDFARFFVSKFLPEVFPFMNMKDYKPSSDDIADFFKRRFEVLQESAIGRLFRKADEKVIEDKIKYSSPFHCYLKCPAVLELNRLPDRQHQALLMSFILTLLFEHRQNQGEVKEGEGRKLRHVLVVEEAHRVLGTGGTARDSELAGENARSKSAAMFSDMLAEIRSFGQSVFIAEQIPSKIIPDALKNTNLKFMMRLTAKDDRRFMGEAMNCSEEQQKFINTLQSGQAVVFEEKLNQPVLLQIPKPE